MNRRQFAVALAALGATLTAAAQEFPTRPVRFVVTGAAGSGLDFLGRTIALALEKQLGQSVIVEPDPAAGGLIAHRRVAKREAPDGYTLLFTSTVFLTHAVALKDPGYDMEKDLAPVSLVATGPFSLVTNMATPFATFNEMVAYAKANPGKLNYGVGGPADAFTLMMEAIKRKFGIDMVGIAYKRGTADWIPGLLANDLQLSFGAFTAVLPQIQEKKLRALAVTGNDRVPALADVPSFGELGMPEIRNQAFMLFAPGATPPAVVARLNAALVNALKADEVKAAFAKIGFTAVGSTPQALAQRVREEMAFFSTIARDAGVQPQ